MYRVVVPADCSASSTYLDYRVVSERAIESPLSQLSGAYLVRKRWSPGFGVLDYFRQIERQSVLVGRDDVLSRLSTRGRS